MSILHIDRVANRREFSIRTSFPATAPNDVVYFFIRLVVFIHPAFDNLDAIEIAAVRILHRRHQKARSLLPPAAAGRSPPIGTPLA